MGYGKWEIAGYDRREAVQLCKSGINPLVALVLASRGFTGDRAMEKLVGRDDEFFDPFLLEGMADGVKRIHEAVRRGEHVAVYGDYDVDGITSSCLVADYLRSRGLRCEIYIPERLEEGYGVKCAGLETLHSQGVTLVVTVDCGITAVAEAEYATGLGMDMVITDHHECAPVLPRAAAVIDPKRQEREFPGRVLAGVGVAFKLICALEGPESTQNMLDRYGDLVAVGTIADVMPVTGENRALIRAGLQRLAAGGRPGLRCLCDACGLKDGRLSVTGIGFGIAPRLNAAGRLGRTDSAVELMLTEDLVRADSLAREMCALNRDRQQLEAAMFAEALKMLEVEPWGESPVVLASEGWHQGVSGIVASRLSERLNLPVVMICVAGGVGRGSCRSIPGFNIFGALDGCRELLTNHGGHEMAAGLTLPAENVGALREALRRHYQLAAPPAGAPALNIDFEVVKPGLLTPENVTALGILEPYGNGNPEPVLCMTGTEVAEVTPLSEGKHTRLRVRKNGECFDAIFFSKSAEDLRVRRGCGADIAFVPQINEFRGRRSVQLLLTDLAAHS